MDFLLDYLFISAGTILDGTIVPNTIQEIVAAPGTRDQLTYADIEIDISGAVAGESYMVIVLRRDGSSGSDTYGGNVEGSFLQLSSYRWQG